VFYSDDLSGSYCNCGTWLSTKYPYLGIVSVLPLYSGTIVVSLFPSCKNVACKLILALINSCVSCNARTGSRDWKNGPQVTIHDCRPVLVSVLGYLGY